MEFSVGPKPPMFNKVCNEMYKRFGACYVKLKALATDDAQKDLLTREMHELRDAMRELLELARGCPKEG